MSAAPRCVAWALALLLAAGAADAAGRKKLIETGWDEPDPAFMRRHITEMEATPFDGCAYNIVYQKPGGGTGRFTWESWGRHKFTEADVAPALQDLTATTFHRFTDNFLRFNTTPANLDWFEDYGAVLHNCRLAASVAKRGGSKGILFDPEQYMGRLWEYRSQRYSGKVPWSEYAAQARRRGREVMTAFQDGYPGITLFMPFAYSVPWAQMMEDKIRLEACVYGLLVPFLDGMIEAAAGNTRIVDGYARAFGERNASKFPALYRRMECDLLGIVADPVKYRTVVSFAFGIRMDERVRNGSWTAADPEQNYFTPGNFENVVRNALDASDEYVWIYAETPRWWTPEGGPKDLPEVYDRALRSAKSGR